MNVTILTSAASGRGAALAKADAAARRFTERGAAVRVRQSADVEDAKRIAFEVVEAAAGPLVVAGGDGLVHLALQAAAQSQTELGLIPGGTGNDLARNLGLPLGDPAAAADLVLDGPRRRIDLGLVRCGADAPRWFANVASFGFDSLVTETANRMRWPRGRARYTLAMLRELLTLHPMPFTVRSAAGTVTRHCSLVAAANEPSYGGGMLIAPAARTDDGLLDIVIAAHTGRLRLVRMFPTVFKGTHVDLEEVQVLRVAAAEVSCPGALCYADGERVGPLPATVEAVAGAVTVVVGTSP